MSVSAVPARAVEVARRPVYCVIEHEHRSRAVADSVRAGRFEYFGQQVELGTSPDWTGAELPPDEEWRIAWSKFYDGLDLAHAFAETGEMSFLRAWERLVASWIRQVPVGWDSSDVAARRVQNWIYAWQRFADARAFPGLAPGLDATIARSVTEQAAFIRSNLTPARNHRTFELYTLFIVALAFPESDPHGTRLRDAMRDLDENLVSDFLSDGVHCECSTHYHLLALRSFLGARENARRFGLSFSDGFDEHLGRACTFALHCHRPDGEIPALSDSDTGSYGELLGLAGELLGRSDLLYSATKGAHGRAPDRRYASFPAGGYFFQRSGWGTDGVPYSEERFLVLDCGPIGAGGHGHYDLLGIEASAGGRPLLVDPGRFTYAESTSENWRHWFKGTAAHNTVCVDGLDQTPYRRRKPRPKGQVAEGRFRGRLSAPGLDVLRGEATSPCYDAVHARTVVFIGDEYWLVEDRLFAQGPHFYDLRFHLAAEAWNATRVGHDGKAAVVRAPGLALVVPGAAVPVLEHGWIAPEYGRKVPAPVVSIAVEASDAMFLTLIAPLETAQATPTVRSQAAADAIVVEVTGPGRRDTVMWTQKQAAWLRTSESGDPLAFRLCSAGQDWLAWDPGRAFRRGSETP